MAVKSGKYLALTNVKSMLLGITASGKSLILAGMKMPSHFYFSASQFLTILPASLFMDRWIIILYI